jgi:hypothetical protein
MDEPEIFRVIVTYDVYVLYVLMISGKKNSLSEIGKTGTNKPE